MTSKERVGLLVARAKSVYDRAEAEDRGLTAEERRDVDDAIKQAERLKPQIKAGMNLDELQRALGSPSGASLFDAFKAAGFPGKKAVIDDSHLKTASFSGDLDDLAPIRREGAPLGHDERFLFPAFPSQSIGSSTSVQVLAQSARTLPDPADVQRSLTATTPKAEVASTRALTTVSVEQLAAVESDVPNALLAADSGMRSMIDNDIRLALLEAKDAAIVAAIAAANPPAAGAPGTDLTEHIVFAQASMAEDGYSGSVVAIHPTDYAAITLLRGADEQFARRDPLAGFTFRITKSATPGTPILIDPSAAGRRHEGNISLERFEQDAGATNLSTVRGEQSFVFAVERTNAIREITGGS